MMTPHSEHAEHVADIVVSRNALIEEVLEGVDGADVEDRHQAHEYAQDGVESRTNEPVVCGADNSSGGITKEG